jgi:hypothetical protein
MVEYSTSDRRESSGITGKELPEFLFFGFSQHDSIMIAIKKEIGKRVFI